ncbi:TetR/AcrR family transcriptional regulator [Vibrio algarum]|uniref:TetR/AcrR family transcriptional regulator n=1 Tax=Vibrio algarum TaxID=3020714 RepID=A0ABT4YV93_9VIBR|nr:TetR/AcrR family transcriptional regulator [Vibrio sp. KJ40-1]MDB1125476.1 TetR/AcrR family transcriptional regulator [Vibrio sp. KJ40-1]
MKTVSPNRNAGRPVQTLESRKALINTVKSLYLSDGGQPITTRIISEQSGFNISLIRYHFGSKEGLVEEMIKLHMSRFRRELIKKINSNNVNLAEKCFSEVSYDTETLKLVTNVIRLEKSSVEHEALKDIIRDNFDNLIISVIKKDPYFQKIERDKFKNSVALYFSLLLSPFLIYSINEDYPSIYEQQTKNYNILRSLINLELL